MNVFVAGTSPHTIQITSPAGGVPVVPVRHPVFPYEIKRGTGQVSQRATKLDETR